MLIATKMVLFGIPFRYQVVSVLKHIIPVDFINLPTCGYAITTRLNDIRIETVISGLFRGASCKFMYLITKRGRYERFR